MPRNASVVTRHVPEARPIDDIGARWMFRVVAARSVASLAPDVPLRDGLRVDVVVDGMATVAKRPGGPLEIVRRVERRPPVVLHEVRLPCLVRDVPLRR